MRYFLGIDISKSGFDIALLDGRSNQIRHEKLSMGKEGFDALMAHLKPLEKEELFVVMESTGIYHLPLLSFLLEPRLLLGF